MGDSVNNTTVGEQYFLQVSESIKNLFELSTRIDERVQAVMKKQDETDKKIETMSNSISTMSARLSVVESKSPDLYEKNIGKLFDRVHDTNLHLESLQNKCDTNVPIIHESEARSHKNAADIQELQSKSQQNEGRWKSVFGFIIQIVWVILASYLLFKLGIQAPL
jgi:chromosome segregation ATPase